MDLQTLAAALAISDKRIAASSPSASSEPPDAPKENDLWVDTGVSPTMMRRWRGADVPTAREYQETHVGRGKNLLQIPPALAPATGASAVDVSDGGYTVSVTGSGAYAQAAIIYANVIPGREYTISAAGISGGNGPYVTVQKPDRTGIAQINATTLQAAFVPDDSRIIVIFVANGGNAALESPTTATFSGVMIEAGDTATAYEPYDDIPFLALDNAQGQIESVAVEAGCRAKQAGTGDPSPENIRAITGRESVEIAACGKNLLPPQTPQTGYGVTIAVQADGGVHISGTCTAEADSPVMFTALMGVTLNGTYTLSMGNAQAVGDHLQMRLLESAGVQIDGTLTNIGAASANAHKSFALDNQYVYGWAVRVSGGETYDVTLYPQLEAGGTATAFEPYRSMGGGTVTPTEPLYGLPGAEDTVEASVDGDVLVTRRTAVLELDGTEEWYTESTTGTNVRFRLGNITPAPKGAASGVAANAICTHYSVVSADFAWLGNNGLSISSSNYISIVDSAITSAADFKSYLAAQKTAGTPVTIVYELATPTTETPADVDPIEPQAGQLNISTDADALSATVYGSGWDTISDQTGLLATIAQLTARVAALEAAAVSTINNTTEG